MSKKLQIALMIVCPIILAIILVVINCAVYASGIKKDTATPDKFYSQWMSYIDDSTYVKEIAIPGTHDAGSYTMSYVAKTQDLTVYEQLTFGVRYLDLRVEQTNNGKLYIYHGAVRGVLLETVLDDIARFISTYKTETLILDFQHFKGDNAQQATHDMLTKKLNTSSALVNNYVTATSDQSYINKLLLTTARGKCIVFWGSDSSDLLSKSYIFKRNNDTGTRAYSALHSFYTAKLNKSSSINYINKALPQYIESYKKIDAGLFVLQGQLTDGLYVFGPRFRERQHSENMNEYTKLLKNSKDLEYINIIMRDFMDGTKSSLILELNLTKDIVKKDNIETYKKGLSQFIESYQTAK